MDGLLRAIPFLSEATVVVESSDVMNAFMDCFEQSTEGVDPEEYTSTPQWHTMMKMIRDKRIDVVARKFDEEDDPESVNVRIVAILEAHETMERAVDERINPSIFFAHGRRLMETAPDSEGFYGTLNRKRRQFLPTKRYNGLYRSR
jgi:hypothetical protein